MTVDLSKFRWPAEWELHAGTLVAWPVSEATWPGIFDRIPRAFARFVAAIAQFEPVWVLAGGPNVAESARPVIDAACDEACSTHSVELLDIPVNDSWCRDYGPMIVTARESVPESSAVAVDWAYNSWGGKYPPWDLDAAVARRFARHFDLPIQSFPTVMEGGAVDGDGAGTLLTTTTCVLNPNRNPQLVRQLADAFLCTALGASRVIWIPGNGLVGDDTDGHIDQLARFTARGRVVVAAPYDDDAPEAAALRANEVTLGSSVDASGQRLETIPLRIPQPAEHNGQRLPMSYCNFLLVNDGVLVPTFGDSADDSALQLLQSCFPDRRVVGVDSRELVVGLGSLHCLSQQIPAVVNPPRD